MVVVPPDTPVTTPVPLTVAIAASSLLHVPPPVVLVSVAEAPTHKVVVAGDIAAGIVVTVIVLIAEQPKPFVYDMVAVPAAIPVTIPVRLPTVATGILLLVHTPPGLASDSVTVVPEHIFTGVDGVIADGGAFTVTVAVTKHVPTE